MLSLAPGRAYSSTVAVWRASISACACPKTPEWSALAQPAAAQGFLVQKNQRISVYGKLVIHFCQRKIEGSGVQNRRERFRESFLLCLLPKAVKKEYAEK